MDSVQHRGDVRYAVTMTSQHDKPKRWRPQLRLSTILLLLVTIAAALGWWSDRKRFDAERLELHAKIRPMGKADNLVGRLSCGVSTW